MKLIAIKFWAIALLLFPICLRPAAATEDDPSFISFGLGYYDVFSDQNAAEFRIDFLGKHRFLIFKPIAGIMFTSDAAVFGYAGLRSDFYFGRRWVVSPSAAAGYYHDGDGRDLGHDLEIRSGIEVAYRFDDRSRLGLLFYHISNAGLEDTKAGTEILSISYSIPFRLFD